ncbi:hypothetical protein CRD17_01340 [Corynebacterium sp. LK30]|nr:hypothetical protein [Corynebacterium sp. LK30]
MKTSTKDRENLARFLATEVKTGVLTVDIGCFSCGERLRMSRLGGVMGTEGMEVWELDSEGKIALCGQCAGKIMRSAASGDRPDELWLVRLDGWEDDSPAAWVDESDLAAAKRKCDRIFESTGEEIVVRIEDFAKRTHKY